MTLSVSTHHEPDGVVRIALAGEVDLATVVSLEQTVTATLDDPSTTSLVVDLEGLTFLDSTGISALLKGRRQADERTKGYRVTAAHGTVLQILEVTGVWHHLAGLPA